MRPRHLVLSIAGAATLALGGALLGPPPATAASEGYEVGARTATATARSTGRGKLVRLLGVDRRATQTTAGSSNDTIATDLLVGVWDRLLDDDDALEALLSYRSDEGTVSVPVAVSAIRSSGKGIQMRAAVRGGLTDALEELVDPGARLGTRLPAVMRDVELELAGADFDASLFSESALERALSWTQSRWNQLVGRERTARVSITGSTGSTVSGTFTYYDFGNRRGPTIVLLSGIGTTKTEWGPEFLSRLASGHRLIVLDYPGVGTATIDDYADFTVDNLADMTHAFIEQLGLERPNVLGWAFSGKIAALMFEDHGSQLGSYLNISGDIYNPDKIRIPNNKLLWLTSTHPILALLVAFPVTVDGVVSATLFGLSGLGHTQEAREPDFELAYRRAEQLWQATGGGIDLSRITNPTLMIVGADDDISPTSRAELVPAQLGTDSVLYYAYDGVGHAPQYQRQTAVVSAITQFVAGTSLP